jgi:D-glycero-D-manno-heptose 1,7-bisphosphate phosphatase
MSEAKRRVMFFDRDDTLIVDRGYTYQLDHLQWLPTVLDSLRTLRELGIDAFIVTNQGGIGRGRFTHEQMESFHDLLRLQVEDHGGKITDIAFCPHHPLATLAEYRGPCSCRKPEPGMILALAAKWNIDLSASVFVGDRETDLAAGQSAGCHSYLLGGETLQQLIERVVTTHFTLDNPLL